MTSQNKKYYSGRLIFDHLHKTGGTAIADWLTRNFGHGCVSPHLKSGDYYQIIKEWGGVYPIIAAHFSFRPDISTLNPFYKHATIFRDPIDRALSYLSFISSSEVSGSTPEIAHYVKLFISSEGDIDIIKQNSALNDLLMQGLSNAYVKHFSRCVSGEVESTHVELAKKFLNEYDCIGFSDDIPEFLRAIEDITGFVCGHPLRKVNVTPAEIKFKPSNDFINKIAELNKYDLMLYSNLRSSSRNKNLLARGFVGKLRGLFEAKPVADIIDTITIVDELDTNGELEITSYPEKVKCNEEFTINAKIVNRSKSDWPGFSCPYPVLASYHWNNSNGDKVVHGGLRTTIQETIHSNSTQDISMSIVAPNESGLFGLEATLVQECIMWFESRNFISCTVEIEVVR